jgi:hypothetical protein
MAKWEKTTSVVMRMCPCLLVESDWTSHADFYGGTTPKTYPQCSPDEPLPTILAGIVPSISLGFQPWLGSRQSLQAIRRYELSQIFGTELARF